MITELWTPLITRMRGALEADEGVAESDVLPRLILRMREAFENDRVSVTAGRRQDGYGRTSARRWWPRPACRAQPPGAMLRCWGPNQRWVGDTTELRVGETGRVFLAAIVDLYSRFVVGWVLSAVNDRQLVIRALEMALRRRCPEAGLLHHSDQGSPYASDDYQKVLGAHGITCSMSRRGNCYDNAVAELVLGPSFSERWLRVAESALIRVHRSVLQPAAQALDAGLRQPSRVRKDRSGSVGSVEKLSTRSDQPQIDPQGRLRPPSVSFRSSESLTGRF